MTEAFKWIDSQDQYALMVAALCHDVGHFGRTNAFLVETKHQLALRYNDKSPLEAMSAARLFGICALPGMDVFSLFDKERFTGARKICITTILHTDLACHMDMVKDIAKTYEMKSEIIDKQARHPEHIRSQYIAEVLKAELMQ